MRGKSHVRFCNGEHTKALEYSFQALERNLFLPQAFYLKDICHYGRLSPLLKEKKEIT